MGKIKFKLDYIPQSKSSELVLKLFNDNTSIEDAKIEVKGIAKNDIMDDLMYHNFINPDPKKIDELNAYIASVGIYRPYKVIKAVRSNNYSHEDYRMIPFNKDKFPDLSKEWFPR